MTIRADRPRIFLTPGILATVKARAARGSQRWRDLQALADRPGTDWDVGIQNYSLCYQVTGNLQYAGKAIDLMQQSMADGTAQVSNPGHKPTLGPPAFSPPTGIHEIDGDSGYQCRSYFPAACICLDWCYDAMTAPERAALVHDLETNSAWVWPATNPARAGAWGVDNPGNNYFYGFLTTWMAGHVLSGESPKAGSIVAQAQSQWNQLSIPYLNGPAAGGCMYEGTSYSVDSLALMLQILWAHFTATGEALAPPWTQAALSMLASLTLPSMDALVPLGDQTKNQSGALQDAGRLPFLLGAAAGIPWAKTWLDNAKPDRMQQRVNAWSEFLFYPEEMTAQDYRQTWPGFAAARGAGVVVSRSSWQPNAVLFTLSAGPVRESHQDRAAGAWGIAVGGEWLASWAKVTSHSGIAQDTKDSNCVSIAGAMQNWTQDQAQLVHLEDTDATTYARADLSGAYTGQAGAYLREWLWLKPGLWLVRDRLSGVAGGAPAFWHCHAGSIVPTVDAIGFAIRGKAAQLFGVQARPEQAAISVTKLTNDRDPGVAGYRLDLADQGGREFVVALEATGLDPVTSAYRPWDVSGLTGVFRQSTGPQPVALAAWVSGAGPWTYASPGAGTHALAGVAPSQSYQVPGGTATSSPGGVLMFRGPIAGASVTVQAADGGGGGGGGGLTPRTWNILSGTLIPQSGPQIVLVGGQLVVTAIPGEPAEAAAPKTPKRRK